MNVEEVEDKRWSSFKQKKEFRHESAYGYVAACASDRPLRVLDVGCGDGLFLLMLKDLKRVEGEGVDISPEAIRQCTNAGLTAQLITPNDKLPFEDETFDVVVMMDVLEHVYDPLLLLLEAKRISRDVIIVGVPNFSSLPARIQVLKGLVPENNTPHKIHVYWFNETVLKFLFTQADLHINAIKMNTFSIFRPFGSLFQQLSPNIFALSFVVEARKVKHHKGE